MSYFESVTPAPGLNRLPSNPLLAASGNIDASIQNAQQVLGR